MQILRSIVLLSAVLLFGAGCTSSLWRGATATHWSHARLEAIVADSQGAPRAALVSYQRPQQLSAEVRYATVPLAEATSPDALRLRARPDLPPDHHLLSVRWATHVDAKGTMRLHYAMPEPDAEVIETPDPPRLGIVGYGGRYWGHGGPPPEDLPEVLQVPTQLPRSALDRTVSIAGAVVLTPPALVGDAIFLTVVLVPSIIP